MSLWIGAAALGTMIVMFASGIARGQSLDSLFVTAIALAIAAIPTALPTVLQVILSIGAKDLAGRTPSSRTSCRSRRSALLRRSTPTRPGP